MRRATGGKKIAHANNERRRLRLRGVKKFWQVFGKMLAVRIHHDRVREIIFIGEFKTGAQRCAFAGILREPNHFTA
jgi:hypothetical protein